MADEDDDWRGGFSDPPMMTSSSGFSRRTCSISSDFKLRPWTSPTLDRSRFEVTVTAESTGETVELKSSLFKTLELGSLFGLWNLFNIYFNIYNKQVLKVFLYSTTFIGMRFGRVILPHRRSY